MTITRLKKEERRIREAALDETVAASFPASPCPIPTSMMRRGVASNLPIRATPPLSAKARADEPAALDPLAVRADLEHRLGEWRSLLQDRAQHGRRLLKQPIIDRLDLTPNLDERYYDFRGTGTLLPVIAGVVPQSVGSPSIPSWNQIAVFLESMPQLRDSAGFAA